LEEEDEKFKEHNEDKTSCASEKPFSSSRGCSKESGVPRDLETLLLMSQGGGMIFFYFFPLRNGDPDRVEERS
jgi:hypothetical protein